MWKLDYFEGLHIVCLKHTGKLEKKNKVVVLGCLFDQRLYGSEFVTKLSGLRRDSVNASLISTCLHKQYFLTFLLSKNTND